MLEIKTRRVISFLKFMLNGLKNKIRIDRVDAKPDENRKMMHLPRLTRFQNDRHFRARPLTDQMMMHPRASQQRRNGNLFVIGPAIRKNKDAVAVRNSLVDLEKKSIHGLVQAFRTICLLEQDRQNNGLEMRLIDMSDFLKFGIGQDRPGQAKTARMLRCLGEDIGFRPQVNILGHDHFLADRVDRRIRDLGKKLMKIIVQKLRTA